MLAETRADPLPPSRARHRPPDLDLALSGHDRVLKQAPADARLALPTEAHSEPVRRPVANLGLHERLALAQGVWHRLTAGAEPNRHRGITEQLLNCRHIAVTQRPDIE